VAARWYQTFHNNHPILRAPFRGHIFGDSSKEGWNHSTMLFKSAKTNKTQILQNHNDYK
jgi:hypothetical protein